MYDLIVIGSGIGGLTAAAWIARHQKKVLVLEANHLPGGCCSSYPRKGYVFEAGATTLIGFDEYQPLHLLQKVIGFSLVKNELNPSMTVWIDGKSITRTKSFEEWLEISAQQFGNEEGIKKFWRLAWKLSNIVWKISGSNLRFPPTCFRDLLYLALQNNPRDAFLLKYAFLSTKTILKRFGLENHSEFLRFIDEQLIITAQNTAENTPFLFAAPALCYTHYSNYYLPGGMITLPKALIREYRLQGGEIKMKSKVVSIKLNNKNIYQVIDHKGQTYESHNILSNIPIWNLPEITEGKINKWTKTQADKQRNYWGAFTLGIVIQDELPDNLTLHHQFILPVNQHIPICNSTSVFVSISAKGDTIRCPVGERVLSISTHAENPEKWFDKKESYFQEKKLVENYIIQLLEERLPGFKKDLILFIQSATPVTWENWTYRKWGTVGGIPQSLKAPVFLMKGSLTPFPGFFRCGDTVYPGQGIPGVALGGIIAAERILTRMKIKK